MKFATKAIHEGYRPDDATGAIMPPIYMTSTYVQTSPGKTKGYDYTRAGNPNFTILESTVASLENGRHATVFSSGLAALTAVLSTGHSGDKIVIIEGVYGGTYRLLHSVFNHLGITCEAVKACDFENLKKALSNKPKWLLFETPSNPLLDIVDIEECAKIARSFDVLSIVDNTFATPYFQNPLAFGVDMVWHSMTKYMGGHSDIIGGAIITNNSTLKDQLDFMRKSLGLNPSPFDTWLVTRGLKTLALRMERHQENAFEIAKYLEGHSGVSKVYYPGLESHLNHKLAKKQMSGFSGMVSVEFNFSLEQSKKLISFLKYFSLAESLGGVESLVSHPATMTHASIPSDVRKKTGLSDGLVRFSIGIEDISDLIADLDQALKHI